jgi:hypothetical protein
MEIRKNLKEDIYYCVGDRKEMHMEERQFGLTNVQFMRLSLYSFSSDHKCCINHGVPVHYKPFTADNV